MSKPRFQHSRVLICLAALVLLLILGGCSSGVSDGGELGGGGGIGGGGGGGGGSNNPPQEPDPIPVLGTSATLTWSAASGPVFGYKVQVSRNGGGYSEDDQIAGSTFSITGAAGDVFQVRVAAMDSDGNLGPMSSPSDKFVFLGNTTTPSGGGESSGEGSGSGGGSGPVAGGEDSSGSTEEPPATPGETPADPDAGSPFALAGDDLVWQSQDGALVRVTSADLTRARLYSLPEGDHRLVAVADFDGDGAADLLFASQGELALAHGTALAAGPGALALETWAQLPSGAEFAASGDFDGDGAADAVVVQGLEASLWLAAGDVLALPPAWYEARVAGAGDADADGNADLLWRGGDGNLVLWRIAAGALASESPVTLPEGAAFVTFADLDGNGSAEVASQGAPDALGVSQAVAPFSGWAEAAPSGASLAGCGDYDGDGTRDRLWTDAAGLRVVTASGEHAVPQNELGDWRLIQTCK
ncbi:MAG TPA: FG-GAP-like repeat-containing protein [Myxococcota bacterium]|nr:FG-GAP-like repeat-containing protein [Myxococcota bacterium]